MTTCDETRSEKLAVCAQYADQGYETCSQQADQGYQTCSEHKDQGYNRCSEQKDLGYSQCQSWSPWFSWICLFAVWISNVVCVAWTWVSNIVCVAWTWVSNVVCVAWTWVSNLACVLWTEVSYAGCKVLEWGMGSAVMRISPDEGDPLSDLPSFPDGFLWGAATSAYQVEGGITNNDWDFFTTDPTIVARVRSATGAVTPTPIELAPAGVADHHGNLDVLRQDLDRAVALGLNAYRFSLEWGRIQPTRPDPDHLEDAAFDEAAARFYSDAIDAMRERGLEPILTLNHMSLPIWASRPPLGSPFADENDPAWVASFRGWENPQTVDAYIRFVEFVVPRFKDRVKWWIPLNEPVGSMVVVGYIAGAWPPGFTMIDSSHALGAYFNLLRAHVRAYDRIKALAGADAKVGIAHAVMFPKVTHTSPAETGAKVGAAIGGAAVGTVGAVLGGLGAGPLGAVVGGLAGAVAGGAVGALAGAIAGAAGNIHEAARNRFEYFYTDHFLDSLINPSVDTSIEYREGDRSVVDSTAFYGLDGEWRPKLDFIGINYYRSVYVYYDQVVATLAGFTGGAIANDLRVSDEPHWLLNDMGWELYPEGLYRVLRRLHDRHHLPFLITENGIPEEFDRNRAAYVVAHLQHLLRAIKDGVNVQGYMHWSVVDNWELQDHYHTNARFGLFTLDRGANLESGRFRGPTFPRHLTEGALALQFVAATGHVEGAVERFGTIVPGGTEVEPPTKSFGSAWLELETRLTVYLTQLEPGRLLGMVFDESFDRWFRLVRPTWEPGLRILSFSYASPSAAGGRSFRVSPTDDGSLQGVMNEGDVERAWQAAKLRPFGLWTSEGEFGQFLLRHLEGGYEPWSGKYLATSPLTRWEHLGFAGWDGVSTVRFGQMFGDVVVAEVMGDQMSGRLVRDAWRSTQGRDPESVEWSARKLPDGLPF